MSPIVPLLLLFVLALAYVFLSPRFAEPLFRSIIFEPLIYLASRDQIPQVATAKIEEHFFATSGGCKLHGVMYVNSEASGLTVLINHGNCGNLYDMGVLIQLLYDCGLSVFIYDYRGYGRSEGVPSVKGVVEDALAAYDYLRQALGISENDLFIYGESLGGSISSKLASLRDCRGLILQSSFSDMRTMGIETLFLLSIFPRCLFPHPYFDNEALTRSHQCPVLILQGAHDPEVGMHHAERLAKAAGARGRLVILPNTHHEEISQADRELFVSSVTHFLSLSAIAHLSI